MPRHGRRRACLIRASILLFVCAMLPATCVAQWTDWPASRGWQTDGELTDICLVDHDYGWITGDRGLLLKTTDGGQHWEVQSLGIQCRLESVCFVSPTHGWVAGGYYLPQSTTSVGVLFHTADGGRTWKQHQGITIPKINQIHFVDAHRGFAIGEGNAGQPAGFFETLDGGRSWSARTQGDIRSWRSGSFFADAVALTSDTGEMAVYRDGEMQPAYVVNTEPCVVRDLLMMDDRYGFAATDSGLFLQSKNGGLSWQPAELTQGLPAAADYRTLCQRGNRLWIAGSPGNQIWRMQADQQQWLAVPTHIDLPITRLYFLDEQHGWAISSGGDVIHTSDGGDSWSVQRRGAAGVALLQIALRPGELVPELFASYCGEENYVGGALVMQRADEARHLDDARQALARVGCSFVQPVAVGNEDWSSDSGLKQHLVRQIRALRPRVILISTTRGFTDPDDFQATLLAAIQAAADINQYPDQITELGLQPWQVGKLATLDYGEAGGHRISPGQYLTNMGALTGDYSLPSRMLLGQYHESRTVTLHTVFTSPWAAGSNNSLFGSIEQMDAEVPRRRGNQSTAGNLAQMRKLASKRKVLDRLLELAPQQSGSAAMWNANLADLVAQLDSPTAGVWLYELALRCQREGYNHLAVKTLLYLTNQFREHPLAVASSRWLYHEYASGERAHATILRLQQDSAAERIESSVDGGVTSQPVTRIVDGIPMTTWELVEEHDGSEIAQTTWTSDQTTAATKRRYQQARSLSQSLQMLDPTALDVGRAQLSRISLNRKLETRVSPESQLKQIAQESTPGLVRVAGMELNLLDPTQAMTDLPGLVTCHLSTTRPWLDGQLDDAVWTAADQSGSRHLMRGFQGHHDSDQVWLACDDEFLYVALRCHRLNGSRAADATQRRPRDSNLLDSDRVEISIDTDRDYSSAFLLSVDSSGRVADSIGDDIGWNPRWYVSTASDGDFWTAELAIPLEELSQQEHREVWAISASRHLRNQFVSTFWQTEDGTMVPIRLHSQHQAALQQTSSSDRISLSGVMWLAMPWQPVESDSKTTDLPDSR